MTEKIALSSWTCPIALKNYPTIVMGHGSGGKMMSELIRHIFLPPFNNANLAQLADSAVLEMPCNGSRPARLAFSTDSFVVHPLIFPGGDIGELAVNGTVNDLAMSGAQPLFLSAGFILEEGLPMETLGRIVDSVANACRAAGVQLVTGDTKVVDKGHGHGIYINTSGIGLIPAGIEIGPDRAQVGDVVLLSGTIGDHGIAILSLREGLQFEAPIESDTAALHELVQGMLAVNSEMHCLRDATRGGLGAALNELAISSQAGIEIDERYVPVRPEVQAACEILGLDPFYIANEGKCVAILPAQHAEVSLAAMRAHPLGRDAQIIGRVVADHPGMVTARTGIGGRRVVDLPAGELLPRIC